MLWPNEKKVEQTNNGSQHTTLKTKERATQSLTKALDEHMCIRKGKQLLLQYLHFSCYC